MSARAREAVRQAFEVATFLDSIGEHKRANDVRRVCKGNASYRVTLQTLHRDNMALREQLKSQDDRPERTRRGSGIRTGA